jgi:FkbM family methyltransferase
MNGDDALAFANAVAGGTVFAFEVNPENLRRMRGDPRLSAANVHIVPLAVTNSNGEAPFFIVKADYSTINDARGQSSLLRRSEALECPDGVLVRTTRLDTFLASRALFDAPIALWIDVEGQTYEAIEGATGILRHVSLIHVEVETEPCIAPGQKLYAATKRLLRSLGFVEVATDRAHAWNQFNAVFVGRALSAPKALRVAGWVSAYRLRYVLGRSTRRLQSVVRSARRSLSE